MERVVNTYNNTPHETLNMQTPNQVYHNLPSNARELLYRNAEDVTEESRVRAREGHQKLLRQLEQRSQQLYNAADLVQVGDVVMVVHPRAYQNRVHVIKSYVGAATVESRSPNNQAMFFVRWLHNGRDSDVREGQVSRRPYPNQYTFLFFLKSTLF